MNWLILAYFIILMVERIQSLVASIKDPNVAIWGSGYNKYTFSMLIVSLVATLILLVTINQDFILSLFTKCQVDYLKLCITAGVLLLSGMVHTEHTIAPIQFGAYGFLIIALVIQTVKNMSSTGNPLMLWLSLVYLVMFSMAIPVMYESSIRQATLFHIIEAVVAIALVVVFTYMMICVYTGKADNLFFLAPILIAVVGDAVIIGMRWKEKVNGFVLIFIIASAVIWIAGKICYLLSSK